MTPEKEERAFKLTDDMLKNFPVDEIIDAMIPVYQKHFTKGNIDDLLAFYSTPTGQKVIKELPAIIGRSDASGNAHCAEDDGYYSSACSGPNCPDAEGKRSEPKEANAAELILTSVT